MKTLKIKKEGYKARINQTKQFRENHRISKIITIRNHRLKNKILSILTK